MERSSVRPFAIAAAAFVAVAAIGIGIYAAKRGGNAAPAPVAMTPSMPAGAAKAPSLDVSAQRLAQRLEASGSKDPADWELLGKALMELQKPEEAAKAFERARTLRGAAGPTSSVR